MDAMTVCRQCGETILSDARFCWSCGSPQRGGVGTAGMAGSAGGLGGSSPSRGLPPLRRSPDDLLERLRVATAGEYEIRGEIGRGGMAAVFLGYDLHLNRRVAIKVMLSDLAFSDDMADRFRLEARTAAKLDHPNIVTIYSVKEVGGLLLFVMKLIEGRSLAEIIQSSGPVDVRVAQTLVCQVARALDYAHEEGVVHRDVKPANIMVDRRGTAVVTDFGIAKAAESPDLTLTGSILGTPAYISPEQCLGQHATAASDQYSLGVVAYQMLAGVVPFGGSALEIQWSHAKEPAPELQRADCPPAIRAAVMRMLEKDPAKRWPSMREVFRAFSAGLTAVDEDTARVRLIELAKSVAPRSGEWSVTPVSPAPASRGSQRPDGRATPPGAARSPRPVPPATPATPRWSLSALSPDRTVIEVGEELTLRAALSGSTGKTSISPTLMWSSSDRSVATVDAGGTVRGHAPGQVELKAVMGGVESVVVLTVVPATVASVRIEHLPQSVEVGETFAPVAQPLNARGEPLPERPVEWSSSDPTIAMVGNDGVMITRAPGRVTLTATCAGQSASATVVVRPMSVASVRLSPPPDDLTVGQSFRLRASAYDARARTLVRYVEWQSSDPAVASVSRDGLVTVHVPGTATITATSEGVAGSIRLDVPAPDGAASAAGAAPDRLVGGADDADAAAAAAAEASFDRTIHAPVRRRGRRRLALAALALVLLGAGAWGASRLTGVSPLESRPNSAAGHNTNRPAPTRPAPPRPTPPPPPPAPVAAVQLGRVPDTAEVGETLTLVATPVDSQGVPLAGRPVTWLSSDSGVAVVAGDGTITARAPGRATLTATSEGRSAEATVSVRRPAIASITVSGPPAPITVGDKFRLTATVLDRRGQSVLGGVEWRSSNRDVARVSSEGDVTTRSSGSARIIASSGGVEGVAHVYVLPKERPRAVAERDTMPAEPPAPALATIQPKLNLAKYRMEGAEYDIAADTLRSVGRMLDSLARVYPKSTQVKSRMTQLVEAQAENRRRCQETARQESARGAEVPTCP